MGRIAREKMKNLREIFQACSHTACFFDKRIRHVNQRDADGDTPLHIVCFWGDAEAAGVLLDAGAGVNVPGDMGRTPLFDAVCSGNTELIALLINAGADTNQTDDYGKTPMQLAINLGKEEVVRFLDCYAAHKLSAPAV